MTEASRTSQRGWVLLGLCWLVHALSAWRFRFLTDDAYISFRYARNWADGIGLRFNDTGEPPVEGFSNFLWVALGAVIEKLGLNMPVALAVISFLCGSVLLWRVFKRLNDALPLYPAAALTFLLAIYPPFGVWSTSGMATMPFALLLFLCVEDLFWAERPRIFATSAMLVALALIRVEGLLWAIALIGLGAFRAYKSGGYSLRALGLVTALSGTSYLGYAMARAEYFGHAWPNTVYAKSGMSAFTLQRGISYVMAQWSDALLPLIFPALAIVLAFRARDHRVILTLLAATGTVAYSIGVGGDFMVMGRFLLPGAALLVLVLGHGLKDFPALHRPTPVMASTLILAILILLPGFGRPILPKSMRAGFHFRWNTPRENFRSEYEQWATQRLRANTWQRLGLAFERWTERDETIVTGSVGSFAYYSRLNFYDRNGLITRLPEGARHPKKRSPGHDRTVPPDFFLKERPDYSLVSMEILPADETQQQDREDFATRLERRALTGITDQRWVRQYVPVLRPLPPDIDETGREAALYWRRIRAGESSQEAWQEWRLSISIYILEGQWS